MSGEYGPPPIGSVWSYEAARRSGARLANRRNLGRMAVIIDAVQTKPVFGGFGFKDPELPHRRIRPDVTVGTGAPPPEEAAETRPEAA